MDKFAISSDPSSTVRMESTKMDQRDSIPIVEIEMEEHCDDIHLIHEKGHSRPFTARFNRRPSRGLSQEKLRFYSYLIFAAVFMITFLTLAIVFFFIIL